MAKKVTQNSLKVKDGDYSHGVLHLAWYREENRRFLIFGMVELYPAEFSPTITSDEHDFPMTSFGRQHHLYVRRFAMSVDDAISWYLDCINGKTTIPSTPAQPPNIELQIATFYDYPPWPHLITSRSLPFHTWGSVRAHHMIQNTPLPEIRRIMTDTGAIRWLTERLFFQILEYPEWFGSVSLIAPNPVFRGFHQKLGINADGSETSDCHIIVRPGRELSGLTLYLTEHHSTGIAGLHRVEIDQPYIQIPHVGRTEQISIAIVSSNYGVLQWDGPSGFLRTIGLESGLISERKVVKVPDAPDRPGETYEQKHVEKVSSSIIGETDIVPPVAYKFHAAKRERDRRTEAERLDQKWFHGNEQEARIFIRKLIEKAHKKVIIVDPYFATVELFRFAMATSRSEVIVEILTAAENNLKKRDRLDKTREAGEVLLSQIKALDHMGNFKVRVMTGKPQIHDRFLVIDDDVWLSGNSLHTIGERAGMIIKLPNPGVVIDQLEKIMKDRLVIDLETWVSTRSVEKKCTIGDKA